MDPDDGTRSSADETPPRSDDGGLRGLTENLGLAPAMPDHDPLIGQDIGGVRVIRSIAEGGMGRVYEGLQAKPRRAVAVKVMRPGFVSQEVCRRFDNEAEVLGRLRHPYIAQIYSAGICTIVGAQVPFFVMEYVADALPLTAYAKQHLLSTRQRLELFRKVCEAVAHGHEKGIVHRDLKPSNILVEPGGLPKVIDFGVARCVDAAPEQMTALTDMGKLIGTVQYMSPEQFAGDSTQIDQRSDVYALGVLLYELLAGRPPYEISHKQIFEAAQVVRKQRPPTPLRFNKELSSPVVEIIAKCLHKQRAKRYGTAADLVVALTDWLSETQATRPAPTDSDSHYLANRSPANRLAPHRAALRMGTVILAILAAIAFVSQVFVRKIEERIALSPSNVQHRISVISQLSLDEAALLSRDYSRESMRFDALETLAPQAAAALTACVYLEFPRLSDISDDTAAALSKGSGSLSLPAIRSLTVSAATSLAKRQGNLHLDGLAELTPEIAQILAQLKGELSLKGLQELRYDVAEALASHKNDLYLDGVLHLSKDACAALAEHHGDKPVSDESLKDLGLSTPNTISLGSITSLDIPAAQSLARYEGNLSLPSIVNITPELADAFSEHAGQLSLDGVLWLSPETAKMLIKHDGPLSLGGLKSLEPALAGILSRHRHSLYLNGITWLSPECVRILSNHKGGLSLWGLESLSPKHREEIRSAIPEVSLPW